MHKLHGCCHSDFDKRMGTSAPINLYELWETSAKPGCQFSLYKVEHIKNVI